MAGEGPVAVAYVLIKSRVDKGFGDEVTREIRKELKDSERQADRSSKEISRSVDKAMRDISTDFAAVDVASRKAFSSVEKEGKEAADSIEQSFDKLRADLSRSISVNLDSDAAAEVARIQAEINRLSGRTLAIHVETDQSVALAAAKAELEKFRAQFGNAITINFDFNTAKLLREAKSLENDLAINIELGTNAAATEDEIRSRIDAIRAELSRALEVDVRTNSGRAVAELTALETVLNSIARDIDVRIVAEDDASRVVADLQFEIDRLRNEGVTLDFSTNAADVEAEIASLEAVIELMDRNVQIDVEANVDSSNVAALGAALDALEQNSRRGSVIDFSSLENAAKDAFNTVGLEGVAATSRIEASFEALRADLQRGIDVNIETDALAEFERIRAQVLALQNDLKKNNVVFFDADTKKLTQKVTAELDRLSHDLTLRVDADTTAAQAEVARLSESLSETVDFNVDTNAKIVADGIRKQIAELKRETARALILDVNADTAEAQAQIVALEAALKTIDNHIKVNIDVDTDTASRSLESLQEELRKSINDVGGALAGLTGGGGIVKTISAVGLGFFQLAAAASAAFAAIAPLGTALIGIAAAATAIVGALGLAAGSLISVGVAASSLVLAFAALKIGTLGVGAALKAQIKAQQELSATGEVSAATQKKLDAAMKSLAPSARNTVKAFGELSKEYSGLRKAVQQELFKGQAANLKSVGTQYKNLIQGTLKGAAKVFNDAATAAGNFLRSTNGKSTITAILDGMLRNLRLIIPAFGNIAAGLATLLGGAQKSGEGVSQAFLDLTQRFQDFAERVTKGGGLSKLQGFLDKAGKAAHIVIDVVVQLGKILGSIFAAGAQTGVNILATFADQLQKLSDILGSFEGQKALASFFGTTSTAAKAFVDVAGAIKPVLGGVGDVLGSLQGPINKLRAALLPLATTLGANLGSTLSAIAPFVGSIGNSVVSVAAAIATALNDIQKAISPLTTALAVSSFAALDALARGLATILSNKAAVGVIIALAGAFVAVSAAMKTLAIAESVMTGFAAATAIAKGALLGFAAASQALAAGQGIKASLAAGVAAMDLVTGAASKAAAAEAARTAANEAAAVVDATKAALLSEQALAAEGAALSMAQLQRQEILKAASSIAVAEAAAAETVALAAEAVAADAAGASMTFAAAAASALDAAIAVLLAPITLVVAGVVALVAGLVLLYKKSTVFRDAVNAVGSALKDVFLGALKLVGSAIGAVVSSIGSAIGGLVSLVGSVVSAVGSVFSSLFTSDQIAQVKKAFSDIGTIIKTVFLVNFKLISAPIKIFLLLLKLLPPAIGYVVEQFKKFGEITGIFDIVGGAISKFFGFIKSGVGFIFTLLQPLFFALDKLADAAKFVAKITGVDLGGGDKSDKGDKSSKGSTSKKSSGGFSDIKPSKVEAPDFTAAGESAKKAAFEFQQYTAQLGQTAAETRKMNRETEATNLINNGAEKSARALGLAVSTIAAAQNGNAKAQAEVADAMKRAADAGGDQAKEAQKLQKLLDADTKARRESIAAANQMALAQGKYNEVLKGIPKTVGTKIEAEGLENASKNIVALQAKYNLTPKQVQTVLSAAGIDKTLADIQKVVAAADHIPRYKYLGVNADTKQATDAINRMNKAVTNRTVKIYADVTIRGLDIKLNRVRAALVQSGHGKYDLGPGGGDRSRYLGGPVQRGQQYLTGERGWELYTPNMQGRINGQTRALGLIGQEFFTPPKDGRIIPHGQVQKALQTATNASKDAFSYSLTQSVPATADTKLLRAVAAVKDAIERMKMGLEPKIKLKMGGIFNRSTYAEIGEAGKEVAIPLQQGSARIRELVQRSGLLNHLSERDFNAIVAPRINAVVKASQPPMSVNSQVAPSLSKISGDQRSLAAVLAPPSAQPVTGSNVTVAGASTTTNNVKNSPVQANFNLIATSDPDQQAQQIARRLASLMGG